MNHRSFDRFRRGALRVGFAAATAFGFLWAPASASAQTGTIVGTVSVAESERPLEAVQVFIEGSGIGTLTNSSGRYLLVNVPVGEHTVTAELVGYASTTRTVTVSAGESAVADFSMSQSAIALDEIVVTGAGVATEKKRLGNTISTINTESMENQPISSFSDLIQGREPGLVGLPSSGTTGEGSRIRIRGSASLSQSNEPIIYVDGIRVDRGGGFGEGVSAGGQGSPSRLDDIDPNSIARIEVLKGAAAATLYGTEASNGVIQIFTKRGTQGEPRWSFQVEQTAINTPTDRFIPHADFAESQEDIQRIQQRWGRNVGLYEPFQEMVFPEILETGYGQTYSGSVQGGGDLITYFVSGRYFNENGPLGQEDIFNARDTNVKRQATANINVFPIDDLRLRFSGLYTEVNHQTFENSNNIFGVFSSMFMSHLRLAREGNRYGSLAFGTTKEFAQATTTQDTEHFAGSVNANWTLAEGLVFDGTFGVDVTNQVSVNFFPFGWNVDDFSTFFTDGLRNINDRNHRQVTGDFKLSHQADVSSSISSSLVVGAQGFLRQTVQSGGEGEAFPGPGLEVIGAASNQSIFEQFDRVVNAGVFAQEQVGWNDFAYFTVGGRFDANSAFGEDFDVAFYPKASVSIVPSDLGGWDSETFSSFRVRAAVGQSGLQPGAFDQFTTFESLPSAQGPGVAPDNLGNPELQPETSTEWEAGAELGLWNDRVGFDVTYWDRTVEDALVARQFPVSGGFRNTQLDNIGEVKASGVEIAVNGTAYQGRSSAVDLFANAAYITEEVTDMGGAPPLKVGGSYPRYRNFVKEGFAPGAYFGATPADVAIPLNLNNDCSVPTESEALAFFSQPRAPSDFEVLSKAPDGGGIGSVGCGGDFLNNHLGKPTPDWQGSFGGNITFLTNFELSTLFEFKAGNYKVQDLSGMFRQANSVIGQNTPDAARVTATMQDPNSTAQDRLDAAIFWANNLRALAPMAGMNGIHDADWLRWRELSLTYRMPSDFVDRFSLNNASLTVGVRNLKLWVNDDYTGMDPEVNILGRCSGGLSCNFLNSVEGWGLPIPRRFNIALRVGF